VYHITQGYDPNNYMKTPYEEINMLSDYYYLLFDTYSDYKRHLIPKVLCPSSSLIKSIIINGVEYASSKYSISDYSSNYFSVNLSNYPPAAERYLRVKLKRTANNEFGLPELKDRIKYTCAIAYGGDSRVFFCGDGTNKYRYSVSYDPSYLPNSFTRAVGNGDELLCFGRQYDILTMFKKYETHVLSYNYSNGSVEFEARCISPVIGCDIKGSVRTIQNRLVFANTYGGAYILVSTARENEKNVQPISYNVDKLLRPALCEADAVSSADHNGRYWLQAGEYTFVWDYSGSPYTYSGGTVSSERKLAWYIFDNISGELFCVGNELYCARSDAPMVSVFEDRADDFGEPIKSYWHSAEMKLGKVNDFKVVEKLWLTLPPGVKSEMNAEYVFTEADRCVRVNEPKVISSGGEADFLKVFECSPNRHRVRAFSVRLSCNSSDAVLALCSMRVKYRKERY